MTRLAEWDAGGIDFNLGDFFDSLFKGVTFSDPGPDPGGDPSGDPGSDG